MAAKATFLNGLFYYNYESLIANRLIDSANGRWYVTFVKQRKVQADITVSIIAKILQYLLLLRGLEVGI